MINKEHITKTIELLKIRPANVAYFFNRIENPDWIQPLLKEGLFDSPPKVIASGDTISFPFWPQSAYLVKMAARAPEIVLDAILEIPETNNPRIHEDYAKAGCLMPFDLAAKLAEKEALWIKKQTHLYMGLPEQLGQLAMHLCKGGESKIALSIIQPMIDIKDASYFGDATPEKKKYRMLHELISLLDPYQYEEVVKTCIPPFIEAEGIKILEMLSELLEMAISLRHESTGHDNEEDYSSIWRPSIEAKKHLSESITDTLVNAVRDAAEKLINVEGIDVFDALNKRRYNIFRRIELYLRDKYFPIDKERTEELIVDEKVFDNPAFQHECNQLLHERFGQFCKETQQKYLKMVEDASNVSERGIKFYEFANNRKPSEDELKQYLEWWEYKKLLPVREHLEGTWKARFVELDGKYGKEGYPEPDMEESSTWVGPTSPKSKLEILSLSFTELIDYIKKWEPSSEITAPSVEGFCRELSAAVGEKPEHFESSLKEFQNVDLDYGRAVIDGLRDAANNKKLFSWEKALDLCKWALEKSKAVQKPKKQGIREIDTDGSWTRKAIASLLSAGFTQSNREIEFGLRNFAWEILKPITDDKNPSPDDEKQYDGWNMDFVTASINTTRGEAMHCLVRYALWVYRNLSATASTGSITFDAIPEAREILEQHLDPAIDPTTTVRSVYGQWFPWLVMIDEQWAQDNVKKIFPDGLDDISKQLRESAWVSYITRCSSYENVYNVIPEEYEIAVSRIGTYKKSSVRKETPDSDLAEHLMVFYGRGKLPLDDENVLIKKFFSKADDSLCAHAIDFIGRSLQDQKEGIPKEVIARFIKLWEKRLGIILANDIEKHINELSAFGYWFTSSKFDDKWAIENLHTILQRKAKPVLGNMIIEKLTSLTASMPLKSVQCTRLLIESAKDVPWEINYWSDNIRQVIEIAMKSNDNEAIKEAGILVHRLGELGHRGFRDLAS